MSGLPTEHRLDMGYRRVILRFRDFATPVRLRSIVVGVLGTIVISLLSIFALGLGTYPLTPGQVLSVILGGGNELDRTVVVEWRLARVCAAVLLGGTLAIAGALFQTVTRNPLASPDILGLSNGAFTGMLIATVLFSSGWIAVTVGSLTGGIITAITIWALAVRGGVQGFRLIIVGIGVAALLASVNTWMLLEIEIETAMFASAWGAGSLNGVTATALLAALVCSVPLLLCVVAIAPKLCQLELGDDVATATGATPARVRTYSLLIGVGLVSVATAVMGPVAFIALAAPQIAVRIARTPTISLVLSAVFGGLLLLGADLIAQHVLPVSLPVGVVTVSVGGLYLVFTLIQEIRRRA